MQTEHMTLYNQHIPTAFQLKKSSPTSFELPAGIWKENLVIPMDNITM
jgi:hypothetical protein